MKGPRAGNWSLGREAELIDYYPKLFYLIKPRNPYIILKLPVTSE